MTGVPWRYAIPRPRYFRMLRLARACPEVARNVDREAVLKLGQFLVFLPYALLWIAILPLLVPAVAVVGVAIVLTQVRPSSKALAARITRNSAEAEAVLSADGMRRRMEEIR